MEQALYDPTAYGPAVAAILKLPRTEALGPGTPTAAAYPLLKALTPEQLANGAPLRNRDMGQACLAGLWLYHAYLDESHRISQSIGNPTGSFWHGIMHRLEPDAWNSQYWFDRVGAHPVFPDLALAARQVASAMTLPTEARFLLEQSSWNPHRFVELCESARLGRVDAVDLCLQIQAAEWRLLFAHCYRLAVGG
jgi:hypothetical protein